MRTLVFAGLGVGHGEVAPGLPLPNAGSRRTVALESSKQTPRISDDLAESGWSEVRNADGAADRDAFAGFVEDLHRRVALLSREIDGLASRSAEDPDAAGAVNALRQDVSSLRRRLEVGAPSCEADEIAWMRQIRTVWRELRESFEELALTQGQRHRRDPTGSNPGPKR